MTLGGLGYGIYVVIKVFTPDETCDQIHIENPNLLSCHGERDLPLCSNTFTASIVNCDVNKIVAGSAAPAAITKLGGVTYNEFAYFLNDMLPSALSIYCPNASDASSRIPTCCSSYDGNIDVCNGLNNHSHGPSLAYPPLSSIAVCKDTLSCVGKSLSSYSATIQVAERHGDESTCVDNMYFGYIGREGYDWDINC